MPVPVSQMWTVASYVLRQKAAGRKQYPLVLMLEPLFRCNLACAGCGKIDYPDPILNRRLSVQECLDAVDECGAQEVRLALPQCAAAGEEARPVHALPLFVFLGPSRRLERASRQVGVPGGR